MNKKIILKLINILLILSALGLLLWLVNNNFPPSGLQNFVLDFNANQPFLSKLKPDSRLAKAGDNQAILGSPVYFNLRVIQLYHNARFEITYQENGRKLTDMAGKTGPGWDYLVQKPFVVTDVGNGFSKAVFDFDLTKMYKIRNLMEFIIDSSGETNQQLIIKQIKATVWR